MTEEHPASCRHEAQKEDSESFKAASVQDAIARIVYLIKDGITAKVTVVSYNAEPYEDRRMTAIAQARIDGTVSETFKSMNFKFPLWQTSVEIVSSPSTW